MITSIGSQFCFLAQNGYTSESLKQEIEALSAKLNSLVLKKGMEGFPHFQTYRKGYKESRSITALNDSANKALCLVNIEYVREVRPGTVTSAQVVFEEGGVAYANPKLFMNEGVCRDWGDLESRYWEKWPGITWEEGLRQLLLGMMVHFLPVHIKKVLAPEPAPEH